MRQKEGSENMGVKEKTWGKKNECKREEDVTAKRHSWLKKKKKRNPAAAAERLKKNNLKTRTERRLKG